MKTSLRLMNRTEMLTEDDEAFGSLHNIPYQRGGTACANASTMHDLPNHLASLVNPHVGDLIF